jgi:hypothetical protein
MKAKKRIKLKTDNPNEVWVTEIRNNEKFEYRETKSEFTEMVNDSTEVRTVTYTRHFETSTATSN